MREIAHWKINHWGILSDPRSPLLFQQLQIFDSRQESDSGMLTSLASIAFQILGSHHNQDTWMKGGYLDRCTIEELLHMRIVRPVEGKSLISFEIEAQSFCFAGVDSSSLADCLTSS